MSFFNQAYEDSAIIGVDQAAFGRRLGFMDGLDAAWEAQAKTNSLAGLDVEFRKVENDQIEALRRAGITPFKTLDTPEDSEAYSGLEKLRLAGRYRDAAKFYMDGGEPATADLLRRKDHEIEKLREKHPELGLLTYQEMFDVVSQRAREAERMTQLPTTIGGDIGSFLGAAIGGLDPRTDPLNFITLPFGWGRTAVGRIAAQSGIQVGVETINQLTGVQESRRLLGLDHGTGRALESIAVAGAAGGLFQALGEGAGALGRRWFRSTPNDPAPAPPAPVYRGPEGPLPSDMRVLAPYGPTRVATARAEADLHWVTQQLEDFYGPSPVSLKPPVPASRGVIDNTIPIEARAREIEPEAFRMWDDLTGRRDRYREWIRQLDPVREARAKSLTAPLDQQLIELEAKLERTSPKNKKKVLKAMDAVRAERDGKLTELRSTDTPDMAKVRSDLMRADEKMRDLAPVVSRAYAMAKEQFFGGRIEPEIAARLEGPPVKVAQPTPPPLVPTTVEEHMPILNKYPEITDKLPREADAVDRVAAIVKEEMKVLDDAAEAVKAYLLSLAAKPENNVIELNSGKTLELDDVLTVPNADGEGSRQLTVRQLIEEAKKDDDILGAMTSCNSRLSDAGTS